MDSKKMLIVVGALVVVTIVAVVLYNHLSAAPTKGVPVKDANGNLVGVTDGLGNVVNSANQIIGKVNATNQLIGTVTTPPLGGGVAPINTDPNAGLYTGAYVTGSGSGVTTSTYKLGSGMPGAFQGQTITVNGQSNTAPAAAAAQKLFLYSIYDAIKALTGYDPTPGAGRDGTIARWIAQGNIVLTNIS